LIGKGIGVGLAKFAGVLTGGFAGGFFGGSANALSHGASFGSAMATGALIGGISAGTAAVLYGTAQGINKVVRVIKNGQALQNSSGVKTPVGQQGKGSAARSLNTNKSEVVSKGQAGINSDPDVIVIRKKASDFGPSHAEKIATGGEEVYRMSGGDSYPDGQFWGPKNPATPGYANEVGLPPQNTGTEILKGGLKPGAHYSVGQAQSSGSNAGGGTEYGIYGPKDDIILDWFHMPDD